MIIIRLAKGGSKNKPFYRIVVSDKQKYVSGKFIEVLGFFNPIKKEVKYDIEKINKWISQGAGISKKVKEIINNKL